jgi:hypothetical protein
MAIIAVDPIYNPVFADIMIIDAEIALGNRSSRGGLLHQTLTGGENHE